MDVGGQSRGGDKREIGRRSYREGARKGEDVKGSVEAEGEK